MTKIKTIQFRQEDHDNFKEGVFKLPQEEYPSILRTVLRNFKFNHPLNQICSDIKFDLDLFGSGGTLNESSDVSSYISGQIEDNIKEIFFEKIEIEFNYYGEEAKSIKDATDKWVNDNKLNDIDSDINIVFETCRISTNIIVLKALENLPNYGKKIFDKERKMKNLDYTTVYQNIRPQLKTTLEKSVNKTSEIWNKYFTVINELGFQYKLHQFAQIELQKL